MATYVEFLWAQLHTADSKACRLGKHMKQPLWGEILPADLTAIPPAHAPKRARAQCAVTAYVGSLFEPIFGEGIQVIEPHSAPPDSEDGFESDEDFNSEDLIMSTRESPQLSKCYTFHHEECQNAVYPRFTTRTKGPVSIGDVVELRREDGTQWTNSTQKWYGFVKDKWTTAKDVTKLKILWLYWPEDTALCMSMKYPYSDEVRSQHSFC
jgi:hypothetical protein